ncbi:MAG: circadian clock protein KaiC [Candidatus Pacebacteria bacterium]|nr:circadian clock protein KaiC [Candidatus Paceibacterota bacterium]
MAYAINELGAKRIALDTVESLFSGLANVAILRAELRRLFLWLKDRGMTAIITAERGEGSLTRQGLEEYVSDCVILLDHRVNEQISTRRLRIVKYRGSLHGTNEYPFLIDQEGISVLPVSSLKLDHVVSRQRVSSGLRSLDAMLEGKGFYQGSTIMISGTPGTGKTSLAAHFAKDLCAKGQRVIFFTFEESADQVMRNMKSIGIDLAPCVKRNLLRFEASRPSIYGLEMHLISMHKAIDRFDPQAIIMDPISNLITTGNPGEVRSMLTRLIDYLKTRRTTALFNDLIDSGQKSDSTNVGVSSLMDTWITIRNTLVDTERQRHICVLKSRGMDHSRHVRRLEISKRGVRIVVPGV